MRERPESIRGAGQSCDCFRDLRLHPLEDRRSGQERAVIAPQGREELRPEVLGDVALATREVAHEPADLVSVVPGQRSQVDAGRPALCPDRELPDLTRGQLVTGRGGQRVRLRLVEGQLARADLEQVAVGADAPERQARLGACRQRDPEPWRQVVQQLGQRLEAGSIDQSMDVVEDDQGRPAPAVELEREAGHRRRQDPPFGGRDRGLD